MPRSHETSQKQKTDKNSEPKTYTKIANLFLDNLSLFTSSERDAYLVVARKTTGNHIESNTISVSEVAKRLNIDRNTARKALEGLESNGVIECVGRGLRGAKNYKIVLSDLKLKQTKEKESDLMKNSSGHGKLTCGKIHQEPDEKFIRSEKVVHYIKEKKETTTSLLSFSSEKIPKELIEELPQIYQNDDGILKILSDALNEQKEPSTLMKNIRYIKAQIENGKKITNYQGYLWFSIAKNLEPKPISKSIDRAIAESAKAESWYNTRTQDDMIRMEQDSLLKKQMTSLSAEKFENLKDQAIEAMNCFDKKRYISPVTTESVKNAVLERYMRGLLNAEKRPCI